MIWKFTLILLVGIHMLEAVPSLKKAEEVEALKENGALSRNKRQAPGEDGGEPGEDGPDGDRPDGDEYDEEHMMEGGRRHKSGIDVEVNVGGPVHDADINVDLNFLPGLKNGGHDMDDMIAHWFEGDHREPGNREDEEPENEDDEREPRTSPQP